MSKRDETETIKDAGSRATKVFGKIDGHHWLCISLDRPTQKCDCQPCPECTCGVCNMDGHCPDHCGKNAK